MDLKKIIHILNEGKDVEDQIEDKIGKWGHRLGSASEVTHIAKEAGWSKKKLVSFLNKTVDGRNFLEQEMDYINLSFKK